MRKIITLNLLLVWISSYSQHNTYYIGHSGFGWDLIVGEMVNDLAADAGISTYDYGFQFIGGTCLANQWFSHEEPQGGTDSRAELASGNYDYVILAEQIPIQEVLLGSEFCNENVITSYQSLDNFFDIAYEANPAVRVYLMEFHNEINLNNGDPYQSWVDLNAEMRVLWEQVADSVSEINNGFAIRIVPVAAAYQAMVDSVRAGVFPGITDWLDLWDPADIPEATIHPSEMTYYLSACVHYATIFQQSPVGLTNETFAAAGWQFDPPSTEQAAMMQGIAWEVVSNDDYASPSVVTGLNDDPKPSLSLYPNPATTSFRIDLSDRIDNGQLRIYSASGQLVDRRVGLSGNSMDIRINGLESGVYIYHLTDNRTNYKGRFAVR